MIEVRQALGSEALWQLALDGDILYLVTQQFVVNVARHRGLIHRKRLQGTLHPAATKYKCELLSLIRIKRESLSLPKRNCAKINQYQIYTKIPPLNKHLLLCFVEQYGVLRAFKIKYSHHISHLGI